MNEPRPDFSTGTYLLPHINREGLRFGLAALGVPLALALLAALLAGVCGPLAGLLGALVLPSALLAYGVFLFFRDPERYPPEDPKALLSPADGRVCLIRQAPLPEELRPADADPDAWRRDLRTRVSVFMSVFNVHVNRLPAAGTILRRVHTPGRFLNAALEKASTDNERCAYLVETADGARYGVVQIAGLVARRIVPFAAEGETLGRGERFGLIRFGSRLDVYLPAGMAPLVREGQTMVAGETALGRFA